MEIILIGWRKVGARFRVRLRQVLQLSSGSRLAVPAELTSMFVLPAADLHVRRAISSPRFTEPAGSSCTFRSPQPYATPAGHEAVSKWNYVHSSLYRQSRQLACMLAGRLRPSLRRELFDFAPQVALATANRCFHRKVVGTKRENRKAMIRTSMSAGSSPRFAEPASSSCTFRSLQPCATPAGYEAVSKKSSNWFFFA